MKVDKRAYLERKLGEVFVKGFKRIIEVSGKKYKIETSNRKISVICCGLFKADDKLINVYQRNEIGIIQLIGEARNDALARAIVNELLK